MSYSKELKDNNEVRLQLVNLVREDKLSIAEAARAMGLSPRSCQSFFKGETKWASDWWIEFTTNEQEWEAVLDDPQCNVFTQWDNLVPYEAGDTLTLSDGVVVTIGKQLSTSGDELEQSVPELHKKDSGEDNSRVLLISDLHIPYHHPDSLNFLQYLKDKYNPTRVICLGDEVDHHALSFHDHDPDLPSAGDELKRALPIIAKLKEMFPVMDILESNHGSLAYRKSYAHGIPKQYLKTYNQVLGVDNNWKWWFDMTITLPNGNKCYLHHGKNVNITKTSQIMGMCSVGGHYHESFKVEYWGNPNGLYWGLQAGCLIDDDALAFNYNNCNLKRPIIGTGLIIDSLPVLEPMVLDENGRWVTGETI